jgi:hypothetical protein
MMYRSLIVLASAFLFVTVSLMPTQTFADPKETRDSKPPRKRTTTPPDRPIAKPRQSTSCAEYGAGFVRAPGSDTCVHLGGGIDVGVGISR